MNEPILSPMVELGSTANYRGRIPEQGADLEGSERSENWTGMNVMDSTSIKKQEFSAADNSLSATIAINASWAVNWLLLVAKVIAFIFSSSKAVLASLVDSVVDLLSQAVLAFADKYITEHSPDYPVGRSRLEALSVIACAFIMSMASVEVIQYSIIDIYGGLHGHIPKLNVDVVLYVILGLGIFLKLFLWLFCIHVNRTANSDMLAALAEDHLNDVWSNGFAVITAAIAFNTTAWWVDPLGAIVISLVIIYRWYGIIAEQVKKIVGHTAPPEFIETIQKLALDHDHRLAVDCLRVYHFGARYNVEVEIVLPGSMTVAESHDLALALQHKIESMEDTERAFVHVDHQHRDGLEHKVERELHLAKMTPNKVGGPLSRVYAQLRSRFQRRQRSEDVQQ